MNDAEKYLFDIQGFIHLKVRLPTRPSASCHCESDRRAAAGRRCRES
jgi:hypothetical protein